VSDPIVPFKETITNQTLVHKTKKEKKVFEERESGSEKEEEEEKEGEEKELTLQ